MLHFFLVLQSSTAKDIGREAFKREAHNWMEYLLTMKLRGRREGKRFVPAIIGSRNYMRAREESRVAGGRIQKQPTDQ